MNGFKLLLSAMIMALSCNSNATIDPVSWSSTPAALPGNTSIGSLYTVTYTLTNNLPYPVSMHIGQSFVGGNFTVSNGCNATLAAKNQPNSSCVMYLQYQPQSSGAHSASLSMNYHDNIVPLPILRSSAAGTATVVTGFISQSLPNRSFTGASYPVQFTYVNQGETTITASAIIIAGFTASTNTCVGALAPHQPCTISGTFTPTTAGSATLSTTYHYNQGNTELTVPLSTTTTVQSSGGCHQVTGVASIPLPTQTFQYADNVIKFTFTNACASPETLGTPVVSSSGTATLTTDNGTCQPGTVLNQNQSCSVYTSVVPTAVNNQLTVTATIPYGQSNPATASSSEVVQAIPNPSSQHTLLVVNQCQYPVWIEFANGNNSGTYPSSPDPIAGLNGSAPFSSYLVNPQVPGQPSPTKVLNITEYANGAIYPRTGCNGTACETANCAVIQGSGTCQLGNQPNPPETKFELNMLASGDDGVYDVSVINGFNVPGQVRSLAPTFSGSPPPGNPPYPFNCGQSAGALIQPSNNGLGACPWTFTPPSTLAPDTQANYQWVSGGSTGSNCNTDADCTSSPLGKYCGMTSSDPVTGAIYRRCGNFLGYWTLANYIGLVSAGQWETGYNLYLQYGMNNPLQPQGIGATDYGDVAGNAATYGALYGCQVTTTNALNTGYATQPTNNDKVCGCYDWNQAPISPGVPQTAQVSNCTGHNTTWESTVFPRITWLKQACPTAYSYQHDDESSQFQCNVSGQRTSYQITFCPGGKTGIPAQ